MAERRPLIDGIKPDPEREREEAFVFADKPKPAPVNDSIKNLANAMTFYSGVRVPLTTRVRPEVAATMKRMSLERQLSGITPSALQDMVEEALDAWLALNGPSAS